MRNPSSIGFFVLLSVLLWPLATPAAESKLATQNDALMRQLAEVHGLTSDQVASIRAIFDASGYIGQGNPAITEHPATPEECREKLRREEVSYEAPEMDRICGARYMAPLYDPVEQSPSDAAACIDRFEFPDIPCAYPVVWVRAREAVQICQAMGKRMCDAHEWEGACAGRLTPADYRFDLSTGANASDGVARMRSAHNRAHEGTKVWSYGDHYRTGICAGTSRKTDGCTGGSWQGCGSNTFPTGFYPQCKSALGVYDLHGNAAEHMNLPLSEAQMASRGSREYGHTEMKGSWFIFDRFKAHEDHCRWRAPYWHGSRVMDPHSHHNYHLGFRCCKTIERSPDRSQPSDAGS